MKQTKVICPKCGTEIAIAEKEYAVKNATVIGKNSGLGTIVLPAANETPAPAKPAVLPNKADDRLSALKAAGVDTSNLFAMRSASGEGMLVRLYNGVPEMVADDDPIFAAIVDSGTIPERRLFRRWVMAQMFELLTAKSWKTRKPIAINDAIRRKGYEYQWRMLLEEMRVQSKLIVNDHENFKLRNRWFNNDTCIALASDYIEKLEKHIAALRTYKCKGVDYKRVGGRNIFVADLSKKVFYPLHRALDVMRASQNVRQMYSALVDFDRLRIALPYDTAFCPAWLDAFKGSGAYFTMQNLIRFHGCRITGDHSKVKMTTESSMQLLDERAEMYRGEGWRMFAMMKKLIADNGIDIEAKRKEWREAKNR